MSAHIKRHVADIHLFTECFTWLANASVHRVNVYSSHLHRGWTEPRQPAELCPTMKDTCFKIVPVCQKKKGF